MTWKIAQAKQHLSQLIREAAREPQLIYNRNRPVAAVIGGETLQLFEVWHKEQQARRSLAEAFSELRALCLEEEYELPAIMRGSTNHASGRRALTKEESIRSSSLAMSSYSK